MWRHACHLLSCVEGSHEESMHARSQSVRALLALLREQWGASVHGAPGPAMVQLLTGGVLG